MWVAGVTRRVWDMEWAGGATGSALGVQHAMDHSSEAVSSA